MDMIHISVGSAFIVVVLGMGVVFFGLFLLMIVVKFMSRWFIGKGRKADDGGQAEIKNESLAPANQAEHAPGTAGEVKLYDTDSRDAAMIMAIVADELKVPLNELRFHSIRQIKSENSDIG